MSDEVTKTPEKPQEKQVTALVHTATLEYENMVKFAKAMLASAVCKDVKKYEVALVKIQAGKELGLGPVASQVAFHVFDGRIIPSSNLLAALVKQSGRYDYRIVSLDKTGCVLKWREKTESGWEVVGESTFTRDDAKQAGLLKKDNYGAYDQDMFFARALSRGFRRHTPHLLNGNTAYTAYDFGGVEDSERHLVGEKKEDVQDADFSVVPVLTLLKAELLRNGREEALLKIAGVATVDEIPVEKHQGLYDWAKTLPNKPE